MVTGFRLVVPPRIGLADEMLIDEVFPVQVPRKNALPVHQNELPPHLLGPLC